ncbi:MAG: SH3 domain-containing protein, partial [Pseudomonadota bacterium]
MRKLLHCLKVPIIMILISISGLVWAQLGTYQVKTSTKRGVKLRQGPGTNFAEAGSVGYGQLVTVVGEDPTGKWFKTSDNRWIVKATYLVYVASSVQTNLKEINSKTNAPGQQTNCPPKEVVSKEVTHKVAPPKKELAPNCMGKNKDGNDCVKFDAKSPNYGKEGGKTGCKSNSTFYI